MSIRDQQPEGQDEVPVALVYGPETHAETLRVTLLQAAHERASAEVDASLREAAFRAAAVDGAHRERRLEAQVAELRAQLDAALRPAPDDAGGVPLSLPEADPRAADTQP